VPNRKSASGNFKIYKNGSYQIRITDVENNQNMAIRVIGEEGNAMFIQLQSKQISGFLRISQNKTPPF